MIILFEEHQYEPHHLENIFKDLAGVDIDLVTRKVSLGWVGYYFCPAENDCVFILPKVLLKDEKVEIDGKKKMIDVIAGITKEDGSFVLPEDIITKKGQQENLSKEYRKFIYEFSVWVYRAINMYRKQIPDQKSIYFKPLPIEGSGRKHKARTMLDVILSLIKFNKENQSFFMFIVKNIHSGMNKINWSKTIAKSQAILQDGCTPIYLRPTNKKREINLDEELFIIFFSILNYLNDEYGFSTPINCNYELIKGKRFESYKNGIGRKRLLQIKYKYFSDKALELWNLCFAFFDSNHVISVNTSQQDFLLAKNFEHVFEAMIDDLIGAPHKDIPKGLKDQADGKQVDHMYTYQALTSTQENDEIYYIGDSKYYKSGHVLGKESVAKQYTYARNVIQWNIDLFVNNSRHPNWTDEDRNDYNEDKAKFGKIRLRKDAEDGNTTEGYNVIPNFFLSAFVDDERKYDDQKGNLRLHYKGNSVAEHSTYITYQFPNRLFDRDTLILSHYDVNFLYVLYLYARNKSAEKSVWKNEVRRKFREEIQSVLQDKFDFYAMIPHEGDAVGLEYIKTHFQDVLGKIYNPYEQDDYYSLALSKDENAGTNKDLREELSKYFYITEKPIKLGEDPSGVLEPMRNTRPAHRKQKQGILVGIIKHDKHKEWIDGNRMYNIRKSSYFVREGETILTKEILLVNRIVLYRFDDGVYTFDGMFNLLDDDSIPTVYDYTGMMNLKNISGIDYPYSEHQTQSERMKNEYIIFEIDTENPLTLTEKDKQQYVSLINVYGLDDKGRPGKPFVI